MLAHAVRIAPCRDADVPVLMQFIDEAWARGHVFSRDEALLRWQYEASLGEMGADPAPSVLVAWRGERLVGMLGLTFMRWVMLGSTYRGAWTSNWVVTPEARGGTTAVSLVHAARELGAEVLGTLGANAISTRLLRGLGFDVLDRVPRWIAVVDARSTAALLARSRGAMEDAALLAFCERHEVSPPAGAPGGFDVIPWNQDSAARWDVCWSQSISPRFCGVTRDSAYLVWRYLRHPVFRYRVEIAVEPKTGAVAGLAVTRVERVRDGRESVMRIAELMAASPAAATALVRSTLRGVREAGAAFADFHCTRPMPELEREGFREERPGDQWVLPCRFQPLEEGGRQMNAVIRLPGDYRGQLASLESRGALYLTRGDGDQDRPS